MSCEPGINTRKSARRINGAAVSAPREQVLLEIATLKPSSALREKSAPGWSNLADAIKANACRVTEKFNVLQIHFPLFDIDCPPLPSKASADVRYRNSSHSRTLNKATSPDIQASSRKINAATRSGKADGKGRTPSVDRAV